VIVDILEKKKGVIACRRKEGSGSEKGGYRLTAQSPMPSQKRRNESVSPTREGGERGLDPLREEKLVGDREMSAA